MSGLRYSTLSTWIKGYDEESDGNGFLTELPEGSVTIVPEEEREDFVKDVLLRNVKRLFIQHESMHEPERKFFAFEIFENTDDDRTYSPAEKPELRLYLIKLVPIGINGPDLGHVTFTMPSSLRTRIRNREVFQENLHLASSYHLTPWVPSSLLQEISSTGMFTAFGAGDIDFLQMGDQVVYVYFADAGKLWGAPLSFQNKEWGIFNFLANDNVTKVLIGLRNFKEQAAKGKFLRKSIPERSMTTFPPPTSVVSLAEWVASSSDPSSGRLVKIPKEVHRVKTLEDFMKLGSKDRVFISTGLGRNTVGLAFDIPPGVRTSILHSASPSALRAPLYAIDTSDDSLPRLISADRVFVDPAVYYKMGVVSGGTTMELEAPDMASGGGRSRGLHRSRSRSRSRKQCSSKDTETGLRCRRPCIPGKKMCAAHQTKRDRKRKGRSRTRSTSDLRTRERERGRGRERQRRSRSRGLRGQA